MGMLHQVLVQLAEDRIPLADITLILESIVNHAPQTKTSEDLTDHVRVDLGRLVCERFRGTDGRLRVVAMEPKLDSRMRQSLHQDQLALGAGPLTRLIEAVSKAARESERKSIAAGAAGGPEGSTSSEAIAGTHNSGRGEELPIRKSPMILLLTQP